MKRALFVVVMVLLPMAVMGQCSPFTTPHGTWTFDVPPGWKCLDASVVGLNVRLASNPAATATNPLPQADASNIVLGFALDLSPASQALITTLQGKIQVLYLQDGQPYTQMQRVITVDGWPVQITTATASSNVSPLTGELKVITDSLHRTAPSQ